MAGNTLQDMITRIGIEIRRPSLGTDGATNVQGGNAALDSTIAQFIFDAIEMWRKDRFRISDVDPSNPPVFSTVVGRYVYTGADNAVIPIAYTFDYLNVMIGSTVEKMTKRSPEEVLLLLQQNQQSGQPTDWAYQGNKIIIYPIPSGVWQIFPGGHMDIAPPSTLNDTTNVWMNWAEQLIRCQTKYEISVHKTRNPTMAQQMSPDPAGGPNGQPGETWRAWQRLKKETNKIVGRGKIRPMQW